MEYLEGFAGVESVAGVDFLKMFELVAVGQPEAVVASRIRRHLRLAGNLIPDAEILIAAGAIRHGETLVTDHAEHFQRIEGLKTISYKI